MRIYERMWHKREPREHDIVTAVQTAAYPDPYSYNNEGEKAAQQVSNLTDMLARLVNCLHSNGALKNEDVMTIIGHGFNDNREDATNG